MRKLGFGCMRLPLAEAGNFKAVDIAEVERMVDTFLDRGFTYFDTAYMLSLIHILHRLRRLRKPLSGTPVQRDLRRRARTPPNHLTPETHGDQR